MPQDTKTLSTDAVAVVLVEAKPGKGQIVLPGLEPILLTQYQQDENVTIPEHVVIHKGETIRMGRDRTNELVLDIPRVSRFHAILNATSSGLRLSDLSSTNGTFVNGNPISTSIKLVSGDVIEVGPAKLKVELLSDLRTQTDLQLAKTELDTISTSGLVTVLVADICDYTKLSEALPPKDITKMLQRWFVRVSRIIEKFSGKVDKYIGDCVMAFWKCTDLNVKILTVEATKAAIEIKKETRLLSQSQEWLHKEFFDWDCRVSLNTGQVMIGKIGGRSSRDFTVLGDVVNVTFRLITVAGERGYDFVVGETTAKHINETFKLIKLGPVPVKGRTRKVVAYTLA